MRCPICGTENPTDAKFCAACGTLLGEAATVDMRMDDGAGPYESPFSSMGDHTSETVSFSGPDPIRDHPVEPDHGMHNGFMSVLAGILIVAGIAILLLFVFPGRFHFPSGEKEPVQEEEIEEEETEENPDDTGDSEEGDQSLAQPEVDSSAQPDIDVVARSGFEEDSDENDRYSGPTVVDDGTLFPDSSQRYLSYGEIQYLSLTEIQTCINDIFAREGYIFKDQDFTRYYRQYDWYVERIPSDAFDMKRDLNSIEYANVELLSSRREELKNP